MLALAVPTALLFSLLFLLLWLAGNPVGGDDGSSPFSDVMAATILAAALALVQLAALALLRVLPWPNPRLRIDWQAEEERLRQVFE